MMFFFNSIKLFSKYMASLTFFYQICFSKNKKVALFHLFKASTDVVYSNNDNRLFFKFKNTSANDFMKQ